MQVDLTPPVIIEADEVHRDRDSRSIECERAFEVVLGGRVNRLHETYTNHPKWGGIYRIQYSVADLDGTQSFICWFTDDGMAISFGR